MSTFSLFKKSPRRSFLFTLGLLGFFCDLPAQVPQLINYQGHVAVSGNNFTGVGQFKFALVSGGTNHFYMSGT